MDELKKKYDVGDVVGTGGYAEVRKGRNLETNLQVAIKIIAKNQLSKYENEAFRREIEIMKKVHHPNVVNFHEVLEDSNNVIIVMDLVKGGDLLQRIEKFKRFSETDARNIIKQVLTGLHYIHKEHICHRDLKTENLLCSDDENELHIWIADFGLARLFNDGSGMDTQVGSLEYTAPEVLKNKPYSKMCDLWSVGVITFILLTGGFPFYDSDPHMLMKKILGLKYTYGRYESMISSEGRDFINKLLVVDPANRMTIEEAFQHPWMLSTNLPNSHNQIVVGNLKTLSASKK